MVEKKRILVCSHWMEIGGAERALLGLLHSIDKEQYEIDLFLCRHTGEFLNYIPAGINLLPENKHAASIAIPMRKALQIGEYKLVISRVLGKIAAKRYVKKHCLQNNNVAIEYSNKYTFWCVPWIDAGKHYDCVISFLEPHYLAAFRTSAEKKIAWIHTDYGSIDIDPDSGKKVWKRFTHIVAVSDICKKSFADRFPELAERTVVIENINDIDSLLRQAECPVKDFEKTSSGEIRILSVGRFCYAKNFDNVPDICKRIREAGLNVKWYLIGYGGDEAIIRHKIMEAGMEKYVIVLGKKENPYPYIQACDLYVQPSRYEGKCVSVIEAQILGKPVVITNYPTSGSQLENGVDGVIVPQDNAGCAEGIIRLLQDPEKMAELQRNCANRDYSNAEAMDKLYALIE